MTDYHTVCTIDQLSDGQARAFSIGDLRIGLFRSGADYFALEDACPHAGASLALGSIEGEVVRCRIHHWGFCLRDGAYVDENRPGSNARSFPVRIVEDKVQVGITS